MANQDEVVAKFKRMGKEAKEATPEGFLKHFKGEVFRNPSGDPEVSLTADGVRRIFDLGDEETFSRYHRRWLDEKQFECPAPKESVLRQKLGDILYFDPNAKRRPVFLRCGYDDRALYYDLGTPDNRVVEISPSGVRIITNPPVLFRRSDRTRPMPEPVFGGDIRELRRHLHPGLTDRDWYALLFLEFTWLDPRLEPVKAFLSGDPSSGKSHTGWVLASLIDHRDVAELHLPGREEDLSLTAHNSYVVVYGNLDTVPKKFLSLLCKMTTGGEQSRRACHKDYQEARYELQRPTILTGLTNPIQISDELERMLEFRLLPLGQGNKIQLRKRFLDARPRILGAFFDIMAKAMAMADLPPFEDPRPFRFQAEEEWARRCFLAAGLDPDAMSDALRTIQARQVAASLDDWSVWKPLKALWDNGHLSGGTTPQELLDLLDEIAGQSAVSQLADGWYAAREWPSEARESHARDRVRVQKEVHRTGAQYSFCEPERAESLESTGTAEAVEEVNPLGVRVTEG